MIYFGTRKQLKKCVWVHACVMPFFFFSIARQNYEFRKWFKRYNHLKFEREHNGTVRIKIHFSVFRLYPSRMFLNYWFQFVQDDDITSQFQVSFCFLYFWFVYNKLLSVKSNISFVKYLISFNDYRDCMIKLWYFERSLFLFTL